MEETMSWVPEGEGILDMIVRRSLLNRKLLKVCNAAVFYSGQTVQIFAKPGNDLGIRKRGEAVIAKIHLKRNTLKFVGKLPRWTQAGDLLVVESIWRKQ